MAPGSWDRSSTSRHRGPRRFACSAERTGSPSIKSSPIGATSLAAEGVLLFFRYVDRPGVVGLGGSILGTAGVNIAAMQVARREAGGEALMTLTVDTTVAPDLLVKAADAVGATASSAVDLND